jgi:RNA polymerase sigma-70 factor (ECF subfamily)
VVKPAELEQQLIARAQQGDRQAFGDLVMHYQNGVTNIAYRMLGDPALAEDIAQETFIKAWRHLKRYNPEHPFHAWLYRIAVNTSLDAGRRESSRRRREIVDLDPGDLSASPEATPETAAERRERALEVKRAVLALPEASRSALILREYEGLSYAEISAALGIPVGTVMSRLNYARQQLRTSLAEYF